VRDVELTTVTESEAVFHDGSVVHRLDGLAPDTEHTHAGITFRTLARPAGELLARFATVNDVHFGEFEAGKIDDLTEGPIQRSAPGEAPYPETMNRGALAELTAAGIEALVVKGDLSNSGLDEEWAAFEACYRPRFGRQLYVVRGNHDAYQGQDAYAGDQRIEFPGAIVALLDTVVPEHTNGRLTADQLAWLDALAAEADRPVLAMGHHPQWTDGSRSPDHFGMNPDDSDALAELIARRTAIVSYSAGHTHRHRVRLLECGAPTIEVGCVKDYPGTWVEHRVYEGGIMHVVHRISTPEALSWSERCRHLYRDFGVDYAEYALGRLEDRCFLINLRS